MHIAIRDSCILIILVPICVGVFERNYFLIDYSLLSNHQSVLTLDHPMPDDETFAGEEHPHQAFPSLSYLLLDVRSQAHINPSLKLFGYCMSPVVKS